ncbi:MAG: hypothetical protein AB7E79_01320 [Rhodospirillaceae bacterium]
MISILKVLFTIGVIIVIYLGFKYRWRLNDMTRAAARMAGVDPKAPSRGRGGPPAVQDLVPCRKCGAYVAAGTTCSCEKA